MNRANLFRGLQPWLIPYAEFLYMVGEANGLALRVTSVFRSVHQQRVLYERFLRGHSSLPAAPPGRSKHNYGLAFDMVVKDWRTSGAPMQAALGQFWSRMGGTWGASDPVHFEV